MRAKPDGLTPVALRAKRPLITPSRPSSSRLGCLKKSFWRRKVGRGRAHDRAPGVSAPLSCKICVFAVSIFPGQYCLEPRSFPRSFPRRHEGAQGPGHFTVRRVAPHSLSPSLALLLFSWKAFTDVTVHTDYLCGKLQFRRLKSIKGRLSPSGRTIGELGRLCQSRACARSVLRSPFSVLRSPGRHTPPLKKGLQNGAGLCIIKDSNVGMGLCPIG